MALQAPDGTPLDKKGKKALPSLSMDNPVESMDLLGAIARGGYTTAHQYSQLAGPKGERHVKLQARDIVALASQCASVAEFASNLLGELVFTLKEAEARLAAVKGQVPEGQVKAADEADLSMAVEWQNRRTLFTNGVEIILKKRQRLGVYLADVVEGPAPTQADFDKQIEDAKAAGLKVVTAAEMEEMRKAAAEKAAKEAGAPAPQPEGPAAETPPSGPATGPAEGQPAG